MVLLTTEEDQIQWQHDSRAACREIRILAHKAGLLIELHLYEDKFSISIQRYDSLHHCEFQHFEEMENGK